ncbi:hypothetical protein ACFFRR_010672 [Megaselia abdita]
MFVVFVVTAAALSILLMWILLVLVTISVTVVVYWFVRSFVGSIRVVWLLEDYTTLHHTTLNYTTLRIRSLNRTQYSISVLPKRKVSLPMLGNIDFFSTHSTLFACFENISSS